MPILMGDRGNIGRDCDWGESAADESDGRRLIMPLEPVWRPLLRKGNVGERLGDVGLAPAISTVRLLSMGGGLFAL